ncbi:MAG: helix-turn-helix domain-containing protein [Bacillota bacterium]
MRQEIGKRVKFLRQKKGYSQKEYAVELGHSKTYNRNVETGTSKSIYIHILEELEKEGLFSSGLPTQSVNEENHFRIDRALQQYKELVSKNKDEADYLLTCFENGLDLHLAKKKNY